MKWAGGGTQCKGLQGYIYSIKIIKKIYELVKLFNFKIILYFFVPVEIIPMVFNKHFLLLFMLITVVLLNIFWNVIIFSQDYLMKKKKNCNNKNVFNFTFDQWRASLLNKIIYS